MDFFEVYVDVNGERVKAFLFVMRLMFSGRDFCALYPRQDATCFLDGHVRAFAHFAGVRPTPAQDDAGSAGAREVAARPRLPRRAATAAGAGFGAVP